MSEAPQRIPELASDDRVGCVVLLGTQRFDETLGSIVRRLECDDGPIALITAGWQDREDEDQALHTHLACETINLRLYNRTDDVYGRDPELATAHRAKQTKLRHKQDFYRIRLEHELAANHVIRQRSAPDDVLVEEEQASVAAIRSLDAYHLAACQRVRREFETEIDLWQRPAIVEHRQELAEILGRCKAVAIAGGHVAALLNRMRLFGVDELLGGQTIFAWSGGGMVTSDRIVLYHDSPPQGRGASEILDEGLGLVRNVVMLPHPETRLRLGDPERVGLLARRFDPALCLAFPEGSHLIVRPDERVASSVVQLLEDGSHLAYSSESGSESGGPQ